MTARDLAPYLRLFYLRILQAMLLSTSTTRSDEVYFDNTAHASGDAASADNVQSALSPMWGG